MIGIRGGCSQSISQTTGASSGHLESSMVTSTRTRVRRSDSVSRITFCLRFFFYPVLGVRVGVVGGGWDDNLSSTEC